MLTPAVGSEQDRSIPFHVQDSPYLTAVFALTSGVLGSAKTWLASTILEMKDDFILYRMNVITEIV